MSSLSTYKSFHFIQIFLFYYMCYQSKHQNLNLKVVYQTLQTWPQNFFAAKSALKMHFVHC